MQRARVLLLVPAAAVFFFISLFPLRGEEHRELSRQMNLAMRAYEKGDDMQAMDRFMEILTSGEPSERNLANQYLNMITRRMHTSSVLPGVSETGLNPASPAAAPSSARGVVSGVTIERPKKPAQKKEVKPEPSKAASAPVKPVEPRARTEQAAPPQPDREISQPLSAAKPAPEPKPAPAPSPADLPGLSPDSEKKPAETAPEEPEPPRDPKEMKKEIKARIHGVMDSGLEGLKGIGDIKILMDKYGEPHALGIPSGLLFQSGDAFRKTAPEILNALTKMVYGLGHLQVVILPEGSATGEAKIQDMRRTTGISSYLYQMGIAPARVKVDLVNTQSQVEVPKALQAFKGIVIVFVDRPLKLSFDSSIGDLGDDSGPPLSLGVFPSSLRPDGTEGVIIEFSISDAAARPVSWKFKLLPPGQAEGRELSALQEVAGDGPAFHQIYWNGRKNYYGQALPGGRYECVLTAKDGHDKQRTLRRWIQVLNHSDAGGWEKSAQPETERPFRPPQAIVAPRRQAPAGRVKRTAAKAQRPVAKPAKPVADAYQLDFEQNSYQLLSGSEKTLAQIAAGASDRPGDSLKITGFAQPAESDAEQLAERRAQMVAGLLINKYHVEPKKVQLGSKVADGPIAVQIQFAKSDNETHESQ